MVIVCLQLNSGVRQTKCSEPLQDLLQGEIYEATVFVVRWTGLHRRRLF